MRPSVKKIRNLIPLDRGFWKTFADGVETIRVTDGRLLVQLKE